MCYSNRVIVKRKEKNQVFFLSIAQSMEDDPKEVVNYFQDTKRLAAIVLRARRVLEDSGMRAIYRSEVLGKVASSDSVEEICGCTNQLISVSNHLAAGWIAFGSSPTSIILTNHISKIPTPHPSLSTSGNSGSAYESSTTTGSIWHHQPAVRQLQLPND